MNISLLYLLIVLLILGIIYEFKKFNTKNNKNELNNFNNSNTKISYKKCNHLKIQNNLKDIFNENDIKRFLNNSNYSSEESNDWDLYLPCGYNYVEGELKNLSPKNKNQKIFAINGCDKIASKNNLWKILRDYFGREKAATIMPETYIISDIKDMEVFKSNYQPNKLYLLKKNVQRKEGIIITSDYQEIMNKRDFKVIQEYVPNLFLIKNRKINIRLYLLIICHNGTTIGYLYDKGKCIYTNKDYNSNDVSSNINNSSNSSNFSNSNNNVTLKEWRETHLTSVNLDMEIYETHPETLQQLESTIGFYKYNKLWNKIVILFQNCMKAIDGNLCSLKKLEQNVTFQLFGADIIFNTDMHPYLLEFNKGPSMKYMTPTDTKMKKSLTQDIFSKVGVLDKPLINKFIKLN
tara:strand:+ start:105 stop:1322 length:1218 start_codon:yes stop_codon:yes gene_type:complete